MIFVLLLYTSYIYTLIDIMLFITIINVRDLEENINKYNSWETSYLIRRAFLFFILVAVIVLWRSYFPGIVSQLSGSQVTIHWLNRPMRSSRALVNQQWSSCTDKFTELLRLSCISIVLTLMELNCESVTIDCVYFRLSIIRLDFVTCNCALGKSLMDYLL